MLGPKSSSQRDTALVRTYGLANCDLLMCTQKILPCLASKLCASCIHTVLFKNLFALLKESLTKWAFIKILKVNNSFFIELDV